MKTKHRLMISVGAGLLLALAMGLYLRSAERKIRAQRNMTTVIYAKKFIPAGKTIKRDDIEERLIPEAYREPLVLTAFTNALTSRVGILKGEQLTKSKVLDENTPLGLAWALAAGETAVALRLNAEQAVGGMINPGDRVNVLCTFDRQPGWEEAQTVEFLSRVRVLAVDGATTASSQRKDVSNEFVLVTLATTPQQSARIVLAGEKGRVSLALLSPLDARIAAAAPVGLRNFK